MCRRRHQRPSILGQQVLVVGFWRKDYCYTRLRPCQINHDALRADLLACRWLRYPLCSEVLQQLGKLGCGQRGAEVFDDGGPWGLGDVDRAHGVCRLSWALLEGLRAADHRLVRRASQYESIAQREPLVPCMREVGTADGVVVKDNADVGSRTGAARS